MIGRMDAQDMMFRLQRAIGGSAEDQSSREIRSIRSWRSCASSVIVATGRASSRASEMGSPVTSQYPYSPS